MRIRGIIASVAMSMVLLGVSTGVSASDWSDLGSYSDDEIVVLLDKVQQEIADRHIERTAALAKGTYVGGKDIPAGDYMITKEAGTDSGIIWLRAVTDPEDDWPSKLYEFLGDDETSTYYVSIDEGDTLSTPFNISLTISGGIAFK